jgi:hypothetical protein
MGENQKKIQDPSVVVRVKIEVIETGFHTLLIDESGQEGNLDLEIPELPGVTLNNSRWYSYGETAREFVSFAQYLEARICRSLLSKTVVDLPGRIILVVEND